MKGKILFLATIIIVALLLRLWKLGDIPPSPNWDEVALGYNAYSIMQTGKDEYGEFLPFVLRSFDDYKPALYAYLAIPSIALFDLNTFAVRLPSAIFGILTVLATYFLIRELFKSSKLKFEIRNLKLEMPELASLLLAISPWHIQFSRIAFESNIGLSLNVFGALFFVKGIKKPLFLVFSAVLMGFNLYAYQSSKVFTPLLLLAMVLIYKRELFAISKKYLFTAIFLGIIISLPMVGYMLTSKEALARAQGVSVFSDTTTFLKENVVRLRVDRERGDLLGLLFDNRRVLYAKEIVAGYVAHFDFNWLFVKGDLTRHHAPNMGLLYLWELPFLFVGIYALFFSSVKDGIDRKIKIFIFSWFLLAPVPAAITSGVPHAVRTLNFLPTFQIFIAIGILTVISSISYVKYQIVKIKIKYLIYSLFFLFFIFNFLYYLSQYFVQQNYFNSADWQYGYKEAVSEIKRIENRYDKIIVSNKPHLDQSYMFFLFYLQYPPHIYQREAIYASGGFKENHSYTKFEFRPIVWPSEVKNFKILYIGLPEDFSEEAKVLKTIYFLDNKPAIKIVEG